MNERLVNIVKKREEGRRGRGGVRGPTRAGWMRRDMKNERRDTGGGECMCTRVHARVCTHTYGEV